MDFLRRIVKPNPEQAPPMFPTIHSRFPDTSDIRGYVYERGGIPGGVSYQMPDGMPGGFMPVAGMPNSIPPPGGMSSSSPAGPTTSMHRYPPASNVHYGHSHSPRVPASATPWTIPLPLMAESTVTLPLKNVGRQERSKHVEKSSKIWSVYIRQSEINDNALVENWKGDMDGLLIFAGLFSAVVTAFLMESFPMLQQDPEQTSAIILARISTQLAVNGAQVDTTVPPLPPLESLTSSAGSPLRLNILWSFSLFLSLLCALSATLVQQWARGYKQAVERRSAPLQRARIRSFLYQGIESSGVRTVATSIPTLLHLALFLFIGGMYDFLASANQVVAFLSIGALCVFIGLYLALSIIPLGNLGSPYQTPLSPVLWALRQLIFPRHFASLDGSHIVIKSNLAHGREQVAMDAFQDTVVQKREVNALTWTLGSFTEDDELEGFVEGIPDFLTSNRLTNARDVMRKLVEQTNLGVRIVKLVETCVDTRSLSREERRYRVSVTLGALAALAKGWGFGRENPNWILPFENKTLADIPPAWPSVINMLTRLRSPRTKDLSIRIHAICTLRVLYWRLITDYLALVYHISSKLQAGNAGYAYMGSAATEDVGVWVTSMHEILEGLSASSKYYPSATLEEEMAELDKILHQHSIQSMVHAQGLSHPAHASEDHPVNPNLVGDTTGSANPAYISVSTGGFSANLMAQGEQIETLESATRYAALHTRHLAITMGYIRSAPGNSLRPDTTSRVYMDTYTRMVLQGDQIRAMITAAHVENIIELSKTVLRIIDRRLDSPERAVILDTLQFLTSNPPKGTIELYYDSVTQQRVVVFLKFLQEFFWMASAQPTRRGEDQDSAVTRAQITGLVMETVVPFANRVITISSFVSEKDKILSAFNDYWLNLHEPELPLGQDHLPDHSGDLTDLRPTAHPNITTYPEGPNSSSDQAAPEAAMEIVASDSDTQYTQINNASDLSYRIPIQAQGVPKESELTAQPTITAYFEDPNSNQRLSGQTAHEPAMGIATSDIQYTQINDASDLPYHIPIQVQGVSEESEPLPEPVNGTATAERLLDPNPGLSSYGTNQSYTTGRLFPPNLAGISP
ncbi:hypothetical protein OF83DRAFT_823504, partial [Amylostereum chailletii]